MITSVERKALPWKRLWTASLLSLAIALASLAGWWIAADRGALAAAGIVFLAAIGWVDVQRRIIPGDLLWPGIVVILTLRVLLSPASAPGSVAGGLLGWALFWLLARLADGDLGGGDVRLAGFIGVLAGVVWVIPALLLGMVIGGVAAFGLTLSGRAQMDEAFPYGPAMAMGAMVVLLSLL